MKENKTYHGVSAAEAERGFVDTGYWEPVFPGDVGTNLPAELGSEDVNRGFLERQNVFERI